MALPPILTNLPFLKTFKNDSASDQPAASQDNQTEQVETSSFVPQDVVEISRAASQNLEGIKSLSEDEVPLVTANTRDILERENVSLGLEAGFSA